MKKKFRDLINQQNSRHSTGPKTTEGKKRSSLNAFKHGLSGNHLVMQQHEFAAYESMSGRMTRDLNPVTEPEKQIAQKIIDLNFRINRITAIENNMLTFDMGSNEPAWEKDEGIARMMGQARSWKQDAQSFEILGRYEARLSRQLIQYQKEFERMKTTRAIQSREREEVVTAQTEETGPLNPESASFGKLASTYVMSAPQPLQTSRPPLPPPDRLRLPEAA